MRKSAVWSGGKIIARLDNALVRKRLVDKEKEKQNAKPENDLSGNAFLLDDLFVEAMSGRRGVRIWDQNGLRSIGCGNGHCRRERLGKVGAMKSSLEIWKERR
jgi:hypothetical protein